MVFTASLLFILLQISRLSVALTGYDCQLPNINVTSYSNMDIAPCRAPIIRTASKKKVNVQVLQKHTSLPINVMRCYFAYHQRITRCGLLSHSSEVLHGSQYFTHTLTQHQCEKLIRTNTFSYPFLPTETLTLKPGIKNQGSLVIKGAITSSGYCSGGTFGAYSRAVVQHSYTIFYEEIQATHESDLKLIHLPNGLRCPIKPSFCHDADSGDYFWENPVVSSCDYSYYKVIYEGPASTVVLKDANSGTTFKILTVRHSAYLYSLLLTGKIVPCLHELSTTDQTNIFVSFHDNLFKTPKTNITVNPFAYFNTKIFYVATHMAEQLESLYSDVLFHMCQLKRVTLFNLLTFSLTTPREAMISICRILYNSNEFLYLD